MEVSTSGDGYARCMQANGDVSMLPGEWAVLGLLAIRPAHGFATARELAPGGRLGRVWTMGRPRVYRAIADLTERGLLEPAGEEPGVRGPARALYRVSADGRDALARWLRTPVAHVREIRSEFLLKLALLDLAGRPSRALLRSQRRQLALIVTSLEGRDDEGFDRVLARYRLATARGALAFVDDLLASG
jgi:DNA-binding PadR family transcriptional regulator